MHQREIEAVLNPNGTVKRWRCSRCAWVDLVDASEAEKASKGVAEVFASHDCDLLPKRWTNPVAPTSEEQIAKFESMSLSEKQHRYLELANKVARLQRLSPEETAEIIVVRDSLQRLAND